MNNSINVTCPTYKKMQYVYPKPNSFYGEVIRYVYRKENNKRKKRTNSDKDIHNQLMLLSFSMIIEASNKSVSDLSSYLVSGEKLN